MVTGEVSGETPNTVETLNDYALHAGKNLPNHSTSMAGLGKFVTQGVPTVPLFRTKQDAYRYAAWLCTLAEVVLPDAPGCHDHTFEAVRDAVRNS